MPTPLRVINVVNSTYGARGNIGFRTRFVHERLAALGVSAACLARDRGAGGRDVQQVLPFGAAVPRALNGWRILVNPRFDHRRHDVRLFERFTAPRLRQLIEGARGDDVVVHLWEFSARLAALARDLGARVVLDVPIAPSHESYRLQQAGHLMDSPVKEVNATEDAALRAADLLLAPSEYVAGVLHRIGIPRDRVVVNPFGCVVPDAPRRYRSDGDSLTYVFVGNVSMRKGAHHLLDAWRRGGFERDRLVLCGRATKALRARLAASPAANVQAVGHVDTQPHLEASDVFVLPTLMEGSAKAVYEAMAAGLPVVTTPHAGSVAEHGAEALLVPVGDVDALASAMRAFKEEPALLREMGERARAKAREYTWDRYVDGVVKAYWRALA